MHTFASFHPGQVIGTDRQSLCPALLAGWREIYPSDGEVRPDVPSGMISVIIMRAYCNVLNGRPSGNVHVGQRLAVRRKPSVGEELLVRLSCLGKRTAKSHLVVEFGVDMHSETRGDLMVDGAIIMLWAA